MKTLKTLALFLIGALAFVGCEPVDGGDDKGSLGKGLVIVADKTTIYDNGVDCATITAYCDGITLTEGFQLYVGENPIEGNSFSSTEQGTFTIWANYGTLISNEISVNVIKTPPPAPAAPEDTNPGKTNFKRRVLLTQFTGTGCGYCPLMINAVHLAMNGSHGDDAVLAIAHLFNKDDPAYLSEAQTLDNSMGFDGAAPYLFMDLNKAMNTKYEQSAIESNIAKCLKRVEVRGGIAVNSAYYAEENYIVLTATVKAASTNEFRIGAWLLEDGIEAKQSVYNSVEPVEGVNFNLHNNCVRLAESKYSNSNYSGYSLGTIEAGKTASREFAFKLKDNGKGSKNAWNHDNLRVIVFITTEEDGKWYVNNVVKCPKDGSVDFEYEN